jgi:hypothetical protein
VTKVPVTRKAPLLRSVVRPQEWRWPLQGRKPAMALKDLAWVSSDNGLQVLQDLVLLLKAFRPRAFFRIIAKQLLQAQMGKPVRIWIRRRRLEAEGKHL